MFVLSKLLGYLLNPFVWVFILLLIAYISGKRKRYWVRVAFYTLMVFSNPWLADHAIGLIEYPYQSETSKHDIAIMLTGSTNPYIDEPPGVHFESGADRFTTTLQLYHTGAIEKILITGGSGQLLTDYKEAILLGSLATELGVPDSVIILEPNARNTYENALFTRKLMDSLQLNNAILVTSAYHMTRSLACFEKQGIDVSPLPTDFRSASTGMRSWVPTLEALDQWQTILHELVGLAYYWIRGYI